MNAMGLERFRAMVGAYGADPARWPTDERQAAETLRAVSAAANEALREAMAVDRALDRAAAMDVSRAVRARVVGSAPAPRRWRPAGSAWRPAAAFAAAAVLGFMVGFIVEPPFGAGTADDEWIAAETETLLFGPDDDGTQGDTG
jgi:ferric-dicitrate binding protein FerR (iron transport regulator)